MAKNRIFGATSLTNPVSGSLANIEASVIFDGDLAVVRTDALDGSGATFDITVLGGGIVNGVTPVAAGSKYILGQELTLKQSTSNGTPAILMVTGVDVDGGVTAVSIMDGGSGYVQLDDVEVYSGSDQNFQIDAICFYRFLSSSSEPESLPKVVAPRGGGSGRWLLMSPQYFIENIIVDIDKRIVTNQIVSHANTDLQISYSAANGVPTVKITMGNATTIIHNNLEVRGQGRFKYTDGAPFTVDTTTKVVNLNADQIDGFDSSQIVLCNGTSLITGEVKFSDLFIPSDEFDVFDYSNITDPRALIPKQYVDDRISTLDNHSQVDNLGKDDHLQYAILNTSTGAVSAVSATPVESLNGTLTDGFYTVETTSASGTGANLYVTIDGGLIVSAVLGNHNGIGYSVGDVLTATEASPWSTGSGTFTLTVTAIHARSGGNNFAQPVGYVNTGVMTNASLHHFATKEYVDNVSTNLSTNYLKRDGSASATGLLRYEAGIVPSGANDIVDVGYVSDTLGTHSGAADPHTVYVKKAGDTMSGYISYTGGNPTTTVTQLITRGEIDTFFGTIYSGVEGALDYYVGIAGNTKSNIVRKDDPVARWDYNHTDIDDTMQNLVTYGYLYSKFGNLLDGSATLNVGRVTDVSISTAGASYVAGGTYNLTGTTGSGGTVIVDTVDQFGGITSLRITSMGNDYTGATLTVADGARVDDLATLTYVTSPGASHTDLRDLSKDRHMQYPVLDTSADNTSPRTTNRFVQPVGYVDGNVVTNATDHDFVTKNYVIGTVLGGSSTVVTSLEGEGGALLLWSPVNDANLGAVSRSPETNNTHFLELPEFEGFATIDPTVLGHLTTKKYVDTLVSTALGGSGGYLNANGSSLLYGDQVYDNRTPLTYGETLVNGTDMSKFLVNKGYVDSHLGLVVVSTTDTVPTTLSGAFATQANTDYADVAVVNDGTASGIEIKTVGKLYGTMYRVRLHNSDGDFFAYTGTGATITADLFDPAGDPVVSITETTMAPKSPGVDAVGKVTKVIGDIGYMEIVTAGANLNSGDSGTFNFEVSGDGTGATWKVTITTGTITKLERVQSGSGYTNTGTMDSITTIPGITGAFEIKPYVIGSILDISFSGSEGSGYTMEEYTLDVNSDFVNDFTVGGEGTGGGTGVPALFEVDFITLKDEKLHVGIKLTDVTTSTQYTLEVDNGILYLVEVV